MKTTNTLRIMGLITCTFLSLDIMAQPIFTKSNFEQTDYELIQNRDTTSKKIGIASGTGTGNQWDFSQLKKDQQTKYRFYNADWLPELSEIKPEATQIVKVNDGEEYHYRSVNNNEATFLGVAVQKNGKYHLVKGEFAERTTLMRFPISLGESFVDTASFDDQTVYLGKTLPSIGFIDSLRVDFSFISEIKSLSQGSLMLPGDYEIMQAQMISKKQTDHYLFHFLVSGQWLSFSREEVVSMGISVPEPNVVQKHIWYATQESNGLPLLEYEVAPGSIYASEVKFLTGTARLTSANELEKIKVELYPNPASSYIRFNGLKINSGSYVIFDLSGKKVSEGDFDQNGINIEHILPGTYAVKVHVTSQEESFLLKII